MFRIKHYILVTKCKLHWRDKIKKMPLAWQCFYIFCVVKIWINGMVPFSVCNVIPWESKTGRENSMNLDNVNDLYKKYITRSQGPGGRGGRKKGWAVLLKKYCSRTTNNRYYLKRPVELFPKDRDLERVNVSRDSLSLQLLFLTFFFWYIQENKQTKTWVPFLTSHFVKNNFKYSTQEQELQHLLCT